MDDQFHREYLLRLPLPLAQLYSRAYNAKDARSRHDNCYYLFEVLIKLSACPLTACYVQGLRQGGGRVAKLDQLLLQLAFPSLGQWMAILREMARHYSSLPDAASHPLGRMWEQLNRPHKDPSALAALYRRIKNGPDGQPAGEKSCTVLQLFEALVQYRNGVIGHGAGRFESFYANDMGPLLFPAVNEILAEEVFLPLGPAGARLAYLTELRAVSEDRFELGMRELTGAQGERMAPLSLAAGEASGLAPNRAAVLWPGRRAPLRLDPLLIFRESEIADEVLLLNGDRSGRQVEYLSYTTGRTERTKDTVVELAALLSILAGKEVTESKLQELAAQSRAATPSVEALTEPAGKEVRQLGDYEILAEIGRGGMGVVYLARQLSLGRLVALKMLPADLAGDEVALARFRREMRALGRCDHPNIVKLLDSGTFPDGQVYYTMEYVSGCDLDQVWSELSKSGLASESSKLGNSTFARAVISASGRRRKEVESRCVTSGGGIAKPGQAPPDAPKLPLPPLPPIPEADDDSGGYVRHIVMLVRDAALALQAVHNQGIMHRDISPANLMLAPDGTRVVLMDFGLAKGQNLSRSLTEKGGFVGKLRYAAPEQLASAMLKVGPQADVRGLGVTLWELLTRKRLFAEAEDERQLTQLVFEHDVPRLREMDPSFNADLEAIVARATERNAGDRIESAGRLAEYLQLYLDGKPLPIRTPTLREISYRWAREHKAAVAAAAIVLATILGALVAVSLEWKAEKQAKETANEQRKEAERQKQIADEHRRKAEDEAEKAKAVANFMQFMLYTIDPSWALGREITVRMMLDQAAGGVDVLCGKQPLAEASVRTMIGNTYKALGKYDAAEPHLTQALLLRHEALGDNAPETLSSMSNLASLFWNQGKYPAAEKLARDALAASQTLFGKEDPNTLSAMLRLANVYVRQGKCAEAEGIYRQLAAVYERTKGKDSRMALMVRDNIGFALSESGKCAEAEEIHRQDLATMQVVLGRDDPSTLEAMHNLALALHRQGKHAKAEKLYREALAAKQRVLGKDAAYTLECMKDLAILLADQRQYAEAESLDRQTLAVQVRVLGKDHSETLKSMKALADCLEASGKKEEAQKVRDEREVILQRLEKASTQVDDPYALAYYHRGDDCLRRDKPDLAIECFSHAIQLKPDFAEAYAKRGCAYSWKMDNDRALLDCTKAIELKPDYAGAYNYRGNVYHARGDYDRAIRDYSKAIELAPDMDIAWRNRGVDYSNQGDYDRAIQDFTQAIELDPSDSSYYYERGVARRAKGDLDRALQDLSKAIELKQDEADYYRARAVAYKQKGDHERAWADVMACQKLGGKIEPAFLEELKKAAGK